MRRGNLANERIGKLNKNKLGLPMEIVEYRGTDDISVKFIGQNNTVQTTYSNFIKGQVKNPYNKSVYGKGYYGDGKYKTKENGRNTPQYTTWHNMLNRCYNEKSQKRRPTYNVCSVIEEWLNYDTFAKWYDENIYQVDGEKMCLDKDILIKGNKIYSPDTCVFAPAAINSLFTKANSIRGELPVGVHFHKARQKYLAKCTNNGKMIHLGYFSTPEEAFQVYKIYKENLIKEIAEHYKDKIIYQLYNALINYKVDIKD